MTKTYAIIEIDGEKTNFVSKIVCDPKKLPFRYNTFAHFLQEQDKIHHNYQKKGIVKQSMTDSSLFPIMAGPLMSRIL